MSAPNSLDFDPDLPLQAGAQIDRLGFRAVAKRLAKSLTTQVARHGLVVSIEGAWGSGKSSLVDLLVCELSQQNDPRIIHVRFEPWLVGTRDGMLTELMSDMASAVESLGASKDLGDSSVDTKKLATQLRGYACQAVPFARLAGLIGLPGAELGARLLEAAVEASQVIDGKKPILQVKNELITELCKLTQRILVIVDDMDRLEPSEAVEIMRLIRAVANFPNVVYILCFDPKILSGALASGLQIEDGTPFLEKIIQVRFNVPRPEAFDLRRWLLDMCIEFHSHASERSLSSDELARLQSVCDVEGSLLETPRDVVRIINAVRLYWPPIADKVDFSDLVWLQMIRIQNDELYLWIERYLSECAAVSAGATIYEDERIKFAEELEKHVRGASIGSARSLWTLKSFLPGISPGGGVEKQRQLFNLFERRETAAFERDRRIASPHHSRYYFAFSMPADAFEDHELIAFLSSAQKGENLDGYCMAMIDASRSQGGTKFDVLLDRLDKLDEAQFSDAAIRAILQALANCMDDAGRKGRVEFLGSRWSWNAAEELFKKLFRRIPKNGRLSIIESLFISGNAIGWLMCQLIRGEIFTHGRYGDRAEPKSNWFFSDEELDRAINLLLHRFRTSEGGRIIATPEVLSLMYGWLQAGDEAGLSHWLRQQTDSDEKFLTLMKAMRGWSASDKVYRPLKRADVSKFMDFDNMVIRLKEIARNENGSAENKLIARELLEAVRFDENL